MKEGEALCRVHAQDEASAEKVVAQVQRAIGIGGASAASSPVVNQVVRGR